MSSQKGNVTRSRGQKHQNISAFRNDKYGATVQVKVREARSPLRVQLAGVDTELT